eukprot:4223615-Amphidinium_carterae.1
MSHVQDPSDPAEVFLSSSAKISQWFSKHTELTEGPLLADTQHAGTIQGLQFINSFLMSDGQDPSPQVVGTP